MTILTGIFPEGAFCGQGRPANVIADDSAAEKDGLQRVWPNTNLFLCAFISYKVCGDSYSVLIIKYTKTIDNFDESSTESSIC